MIYSKTFNVYMTEQEFIYHIKTNLLAGFLKNEMFSTDICKNTLIAKVMNFSKVS